MAEEKKKEKEEEADDDAAEATAAAPAEKKKLPILTLAVFAINTLFNMAIAFLVFQNTKAIKTKETIQDVVDGMKKSEGAGHEGGGGGEHGSGHGGEEAHGGGSKNSHLPDLVLMPIETFVVNLLGDEGTRYVKVDMELELSKGEVTAEIDKRKPQIRDIIINLLSSKTFDKIDSQEDKEFLREEIKNTVNGFLVTGKVLKVYFSQFIIS